MVWKTDHHSSGKSKLQFKNKHEGLKSYKSKPNYHGKKKHGDTVNRPNRDKAQSFPTSSAAKVKPFRPKCKEESSDSEPDAFSQLVACFSKTSKREAVLSDEESDSSEEMCPTEGQKSSMETNQPKVDKDSSIDEDSADDLNSENGEIINEDINNDNTKTAMLSVRDSFENHIQYDLDEKLYNAVSTIPQKTEEFTKNWPVLGQLRIVLPKPIKSNVLQMKSSVRIDEEVQYAKPGEIPQRIEHVDWGVLSVKSKIHGNILRTNQKYVDETLSEEEKMTSLQKEMFSIINNYQDLYYPERTLDNGEEVRFVYCLHAINHALKTRLKVIHHNTRLVNKDLKGVIPDEFRDQGLIRPKVLILLPFRNSAHRVVKMLASILLDEGNNNILNIKRFDEEFTSHEIAMPHKNPKPEDYERTFTGDTDDNFKIGISITKKSFKLYADFYSADIIVASPLALRVIVGAAGQVERDFDFLASIELLILDQAEIIYMQNWDHLLQIWDHLHMQPKQSHGTNFARVRPWALSGRARYYRQTLLFSAYSLPQISALFSRKCYNYAGKVSVVNAVKTGTICQIVLQLPQVFNRIECSSPTDSIDARFNYFISKVLPEFKESMMSHTLIYVPSYFDYVRIRNYFKKETVSFVQICEYSKDGKIARARDMFFHSSAHFLLYSERFHFFRRIRLKGIRHIIFYQPPTIPHFYSELCNLMQNDKQAEEGSLSVSVLYSRYDTAQLAAIVGTDRTARMLASDRSVHMFMTGD